MTEFRSRTWVVLLEDHVLNRAVILRKGSLLRVISSIPSRPLLLGAQGMVESIELTPDKVEAVGGNPDMARLVALQDAGSYELRLDSFKNDLFEVFEIQGWRTETLEDMFNKAALEAPVSSRAFIPAFRNAIIRLQAEGRKGTYKLPEFPRIDWNP